MVESWSTGEPSRVVVSRRKFLAGAGAVGLGVLATACSSKAVAPSPSVPASPTLRDLQRGVTGVSLLSPGTPVQPGEQFFAFDLITSSQQIIESTSPELWLFADTAGIGTGPIPATWYPFTGYGLTGDHSPRSDLPGTYIARLSVPSAGVWAIAARASAGGRPILGVGQLPVTDGHVVAAVGSKAIPVDTPVATTVPKLKEICTRDPVCHLHSVSLGGAVRSGRPTVVAFATPLLCESRLCGPVLDEVLLVSRRLGSQANFIHVEEFLPGPHLSPPSPTLQNQSPGFKAWGFADEPWVIVIDRKGVVRGRLGPGPSVAPEIEKALEPLL